jgi:hypothetical protein
MTALGLSSPAAWVETVESRRRVNSMKAWGMKVMEVSYSFKR